MNGPVLEKIAHELRVELPVQPRTQADRVNASNSPGTGGTKNLPTTLPAMYAGGSSMAIVAASDFTPHTSVTRLLFPFNSLIGMSVISLTLTYLMQVYTALQRRNVLAMNIHLLSRCTGDAAELLAHLGPEGQFNAGYTNLSELSVEMTQAKDAHHFYPVLFYFRFSDSHHSVSRSTLVAFDMVSFASPVVAGAPGLLSWSSDPAIATDRPLWGDWRRVAVPTSHGFSRFC